MSEKSEIDHAQIEGLGAATGTPEPVMDHSKEDEKVTAISVLTVIVSFYACSNTGKQSSSPCYLQAIIFGYMAQTAVILAAGIGAIFGLYVAGAMVKTNPSG